MLDWDGRTAHARHVSVNYYTKPRDRKDIDTLQVLDASQQPLPSSWWGIVMVKLQVYGCVPFSSLSGGPNHHLRRSAPLYFGVRTVSFCWNRGWDGWQLTTIMCACFGS